MNPKVRERAVNSQATGQANSQNASDRGSSEVQKTARGTALNLGGSILATAVTFFTIGLITRTYGTEGAGVFFAVTALFTLASNGARLGTETSLTFFVSRLRASGQHDRIQPLVFRALAGTAIAATTVAAIGLATAPTLAQRFTTDDTYVAEVTLMIRILAAGVPAFALTHSMFGASRGFGTMRPSVIAGQIVRPTTQLVLVAGLVLLSSELLWPLAIIWAVSSFAAALTIGRWLTSRLRLVSTRQAATDQTLIDNGEQLPTYMSFTGPRALSDVLSAGLERLDVILVAALLGEAAAGLYGTANRLILAGQLMMIATAQSMSPHLSAAFSKGEGKESQHMLRTITGWNVLILWPMFLGIAFGAEPALSLFGKEFVEAAPLVQVLAVAFLVISGLGTGDTVLMMTGKSKASLANHAISLAVMVGASLVLLPNFGVIGAAIAWALSRITLRCLAGFHVYLATGIHAFGRPVIIAAVCASISFIPTGFASVAIFDPGFTAIAFHAFVGGAIYLMATGLCRNELAASDLLAVVKRR